MSATNAGRSFSASSFSTSSGLLELSGCPPHAAFASSGSVMIEFCGIPDESQ